MTNTQRRALVRARSMASSLAQRKPAVIGKVMARKRAGNHVEVTEQIQNLHRTACYASLRKRPARRCDGGGLRLRQKLFVRWHHSQMPRMASTGRMHKRAERHF